MAWSRTAHSESNPQDAPFPRVEVLPWNYASPHGEVQTAIKPFPFATVACKSGLKDYCALRELGGLSSTAFIKGNYHAARRRKRSSYIIYYYLNKTKELRADDGNALYHVLD